MLEGITASSHQIIQDELKKAADEQSFGKILETKNIFPDYENFIVIEIQSPTIVQLRAFCGCIQPKLIGLVKILERNTRIQKIELHTKKFSTKLSIKWFFGVEFVGPVLDLSAECDMFKKTLLTKVNCFSWFNLIIFFIQ